MTLLIPPHLYKTFFSRGACSASRAWMWSGSLICNKLWDAFISFESFLAALLPGCFRQSYRASRSLWCQVSFVIVSSAWWWPCLLAMWKIHSAIVGAGGWKAEGLCWGVFATETWFRAEWANNIFVVSALNLPWLAFLCAVYYWVPSMIIIILNFHCSWHY